MNSSPQAPERDRDDAVWDLLEKAPAPQASPHFAQRTVMAALATDQSQAWWKSLFAPLPLTGLATATALLLFVITGTISRLPDANPTTVSTDYRSIQAEEIQEIAETEILLAAADDLGDFSDHELICLLGF